MSGHVSGQKGGLTVSRLVAIIAGLSVLSGSVEALACGGLFCNSGTVAIPPAQSAERIVFVQNPLGHTAPPEGMLEVGYDEQTDPNAPEVQPYSGASIDVYIEIAYTGAVDDFAWLVPMLEKPVLIGTARQDLFNDLDQATAPRFTFTYSGGSTSVPTSSSAGCGGASYDMAAGAGDDDDAGDGLEADPEVTLLDHQNVGPYEVVVLQAETAGDLRDWLLQHDYEIPELAEPLLETYVQEGKKFAAFRLSDGEGVGAIEPVVLRIPGNEPCVPLRLTPVASDPVVTVSAIVLGAGLTRPVNFSDTAMDVTSIAPTSPVTTDYGDRLRAATRGLGGRAVETEYAAPAGFVEAYVDVSQQLLSRAGFVTRLSTRIAPEEMTDDPIFEVTDAQTQISRDHVIDVTDDPAAQQALGIAPAASGGGGSSGGTCAAVAGRPLHSVYLLACASIALVIRRARRRATRS